METRTRYHVNRDADASALNATNVGKSRFALQSLMLQVRLPTAQISHLRLRSQNCKIHMNQTGYTTGAIIT